MVEFLLFGIAAALLQTAHLYYATSNIWMAIRGASPRYLSIGKKFNGDLSYRVGAARELTLKGSLASPTSLLSTVPVFDE